MILGQAERLIEISKLGGLQKNDNQNNIITFTSGKGGTGKTVLSLNVADSLASSGIKTLFIDFDLNLANAGVMLNIFTDKAISNYFRERESIANLIYPLKHNFDLILGDSGRVDFPTPTLFAVNNFFMEINTLKDEYDVIIVDAGAGISEIQIEMLKHSLAAVIVSTPEPTAIMDAYVVHKILKFNNFKGIKWTVINKSTSDEESKTASNNLASAVTHFIKEKVEIIGCINDDTNVSRSIKTQQLLSEEFNTSTSTLQIKELAQRIYENIQVANIKQVR